MQFFLRDSAKGEKVETKYILQIYTIQQSVLTKNFLCGNLIEFTRQNQKK